MPHRRLAELPTAAVACSGQVVSVPLRIRPAAAAAAIDRVGCTMLLLSSVGSLFGVVGGALLDFSVDDYDGGAGSGVLSAREGALPFLRAAAAAVTQQGGTRISVALAEAPPR